MHLHLALREIVCFNDMWTMWRLPHPTKKKFSLPSIPRRNFRNPICSKNTTILGAHTLTMEIKITLQLQEQKICRSVSIASHTLCGDCRTQPKRNSPYHPFQKRISVTNSALKIRLLFARIPSPRKSRLLFNHKKKAGKRQTQCSNTVCGC